MGNHRLGVVSPYLIQGFGAALFLIAIVHHGIELSTLNGLVGPSVAVLLDGLPALGLVYAGYWLAETDLPPDGRWRACRWCIGGATLFVAVMGISLLVRAFEGRTVGEPLLPLLIAAEAGGFAGLIAGYSTGRARVETRRARTINDALGFVNSLLRHDLRNDLNVIQGHAELIDTGGGSAATETDGESSSIIAEKAEEALARLNTTRVVAETLTGDADVERVDLAAITTEMATQIETAHDVSVTTAIPDEVSVTANAGLRSVVDNLLENAVEHNDAEDPRVHVTVETTTETARLIVADNGPGIPDEHKERLREPRSGASGSGGLSLVQRLVEEYDGTVWIDDNDPRGSKVIVELSRPEPSQQ